MQANKATSTLLTLFLITGFINCGSGPSKLFSSYSKINNSSDSLDLYENYLAVLNKEQSLDYFHLLVEGLPTDNLTNFYSIYIESLKPDLEESQKLAYFIDLLYFSSRRYRYGNDALKLIIRSVKDRIKIDSEEKKIVSSCFEKNDKGQETLNVNVFTDLIVYGSLKNKHVTIFYIAEKIVNLNYKHSKENVMLLLVETRGSNIFPSLQG